MLTLLRQMSVANLDVPGPRVVQLIDELERVRKERTTWEMGMLASLLALGLDTETAERVGARIRALSTT